MWYAVDDKRDIIAVEVSLCALLKRVELIPFWKGKISITPDICLLKPTQAEIAEQLSKMSREIILAIVAAAEREGSFQAIEPCGKMFLSEDGEIRCDGLLDWSECVQGCLLIYNDKNGSTKGVKL